ncbi:energy-coupling factor transporter transmembrane protein EcfT [Myxococcota bacterium]|nr:energy-coupling factor transporter transmembrane protein EcfT [Myxococcota bacterium]MBU1429257.1 energy-coupling factor transporter transmembrane protein EcfT [Myxococcota bacterium]MBU1896541.1 energy-coupling factor transporter transmembrane protein EcfT [Myxococcota bacterium]
MRDPLLTLQRSLRALERAPARAATAALPDARAQIIITFAFALTIATFDPKAPQALTPLFLFPLLSLRAARASGWALLGRLALLSPLALLYAAANPLYDAALIRWGGVTLRAGWLTGLSILLRFALTVSAALLLLTTRRFDEICAALDGLGLPRALTIQLRLLYRYLDLLLDEALRLTRARRLKAARLPLRLHARMLGGLLDRALSRGARVEQAMRLRGALALSPPRATRLRARDLRYLIGWGAFLLSARLCASSGL